MNGALESLSRPGGISRALDRPHTEDETVARALATLGSETRLAILRLVRTPKRLRDIELEGAHAASGATISRQAVREHIDRLMEVGIVVERASDGDARSPREYLLNHQAIFALAEEMKGLARLRPFVEVSLDTAPLIPPAASPSEGARLVLVKGLDEGVVYDLRPEYAPTGEWTIGRRRGLAVSLDFDPFVSAENAVIRWSGGKHLLRNAPESRNGTRLNLRPMESEEERALRHGDLIGVGRSLLLYWS